MSTSPQPSSPQLAQFAVDWNQVALQAITAGLDEIPVVGTILSHIVSLSGSQPDRMSGPR